MYVLTTENTENTEFTEKNYFFNPLTLCPLCSLW